MFHVHKSKNKQFFFHIVAKNGNIIATSETYTRKANCVKAIKGLVKRIKEGEGDIEDHTFWDADK